MAQKHISSYAGVLVIDLYGNIVAQLRDDKPTISDPGKLCFFAGAMEPGETPLQGALREVGEETNLGLTAEQVELFATYKLHNKPQTFHAFIARGIDVSNLEVYEGQGARLVTDRNDPLIADAAKPAFDKWFDELEPIQQAGSQRHTPVHHAAGVLLQNQTGQLVGQLRDDFAHIDDPGMVGVFGGKVEDGELPLEAALRELEEETNVTLTADDLTLIDGYVVWRELTKKYQHVTLYVSKPLDLSKLEVYEGRGGQVINGPDDPNLSLVTKWAAGKWFANKD